ncbi:TetR/AcrR family transcriptional regulator [soil metagenome]
MPRAGLTRQVVIAEAAALADLIGYDALTLTALAERVGVAVPSLYKHVASLDDLRRGVAVLALRELGEALVVGLSSAPGRPGAPGRTPLHALADAFRSFATDHPGRYAATVRAVTADDPEPSAAAEAALATVLDVLGAMGIRGDAAVHAARALRATLHGFVALEQAAGFGLPQDVDESFARSVAWLEQGLMASTSGPPDAR